MPSVVNDLAEFVATLRFEDIPERGREAARIGMTDCLSTMIAGAGEPAPRKVAALVHETAQKAFATDVTTGRRLDPADAALVDGTAAHVLDYDDVALSGHPSAVLTPVVLALGRAAGIGGKDAIRAYAAGYETWAQLQLLEPGQLHDVGFHPTAVLGTVAAAAAAARILGLDADACANALGISASMAAGLTANFGTMTKSFQVGRAAQAGIQAARLAARGFTGSPDAIEHPRGFLHAFSPSRSPERAFREKPGVRWRLEMMGVNLKRYPTCYATHRSIDAMLALAEAHDLAVSDVAEIDVRTGATQHRMLRNARPRTGLEAKFSLEFAMAAALVARRVGLEELTDAFVARADIRACLERVRITTTEDTMPGDETFAPADLVGVVLADGRAIEHPPVVHAKGSWQNPLGRDERREKFVACAASSLGGGAAERLFEAMERLEHLNELPAIAITGPARVSAQSEETT